MFILILSGITVGILLLLSLFSFWGWDYHEALIAFTASILAAALLFGLTCHSYTVRSADIEVKKLKYAFAKDGDKPCLFVNADGRVQTLYDAEILANVEKNPHFIFRTSYNAYNGVIKERLLWVASP